MGLVLITQFCFLEEREKKEQQVEQLLEDVQEEEAKMADFKKDKKTDTRKRKRETRKEEDEEEEDDDGLDPEIRAMMGFSGFSTSKRWSDLWFPIRITMKYHYMIIHL